MPENEPRQGLQFSKKTIISITILLFAVLMLAGALTQLVPRGEYQRVEGTEQVIPGTYTETEWKLPFWKVFASPGLIFTSSTAVAGVAILLFIILIGGTFLVLEKSGVLQYILSAIAAKYANKKYTLLALVVLVCMLLGSVIGVLEESLTLVPLAAAIALALGWDSLMGLGMSLVAVAFGYSAATFNPFNVVIVQQLAGLPIFSGVLYRVLVFALVYGVLLGFLYLYGKRIDKNPQKSIAYETDKTLRKKYANLDSAAILANPALKDATKIFVSCVCGVFVFAGIGFALQNASFVPESLHEYVGYLPTISMAILFPVGGLTAGKKAGLRGKALSGGFWDGVKAIAPAIPLLILVLCVTFILKEGKIMDTMVFHIYDLCNSLTPTAALLVIFLFVLVLEFFVGSGSAKAFLIMPIIVPLAGMLSLSMQSVTLSFCLSDGFGNILYPTSGIMILAIGMLGVSYGKYMRWFGKLFLLEMAVCAAVMLLAVKIGY
ncbi:MAG: hypothetical protein LBT21_01725 [Oscillospiraceae bacterium]|jgi:uncharacterized ion transporter superfamily protein YfcC|nr:hypothetical protein [Oscillospiraceae bacterium]